MNAIKMMRVELLAIVRTNLAEHTDMYAESVEDYKAAVLKLETANLKLAKTGDLEKFKQIRPIPSAPVSYADSYRRAERMLELSIEEEIMVEEDVFNQLVLDEWSWKRGFVGTSALYKSI
jgi:hypothetical protein